MTEFKVYSAEMTPLSRTGIKKDLEKNLASLKNKKLYKNTKNLIQEHEFHEGGKDFDENMYISNLQLAENVSFINEDQFLATNESRDETKEGVPSTIRDEVERQESRDQTNRSNVIDSENDKEFEKVSFESELKKKQMTHTTNTTKVSNDTKDKEIKDFKALETPKKYLNFESEEQDKAKKKIEDFKNNMNNLNNVFGKLFTGNFAELETPEQKKLKEKTNEVKGASQSIKNQINNSEWESALDAYSKVKLILYIINFQLCVDIDLFLEENKNLEEKSSLAVNFAKLKEEKINALSTKSMILNKLGKYKESIDIDNQILQINSKYHTSVARSIMNYIRLDNLNEANRYAGILNLQFSKDIVDRYTEYLFLLDNKNKQASDEFKPKEIIIQEEIKLSEKDKKSKEEPDVSGGSSSLLISFILLPVIAAIGYYFFKKLK